MKERYYKMIVNPLLYYCEFVDFISRNRLGNKLSLQLVVNFYRSRTALVLSNQPGISKFDIPNHY